MTVLYFSIINVLCGAGGDASFAPQANLVLLNFPLIFSDTIVTEGGENFSSGQRQVMSHLVGKGLIYYLIKGII